jgi:hypothetical protein
MAKKDISKLLTTGSPKQKLLLLAENSGGLNFGKPAILTDHEINQISDSFKKPNEIKLWNSWLKVEKKVGVALMGLQGLLFEVKMNYSNLRGYILVWNSIENGELLVNSVLHEIKDPIERKRIANSGGKGVDLLFSKTTTDEEGYVDIKIDFDEDSYEDENGKLIGFKEKPRKTKEYSLLNIMNNVKNEANTSIIKFLSWRQAILDYMDETGFNVKTYKEIIEGFTKEVYSPVIGWGKYEGEIRTGSPHPQVEKLIKKYAVTPKIEELEVDEEIYNTFKKDFLGDE